jgi:hypothetical protein
VAFNHASAKIEFKAWADYLDDSPLAMAFLNRLIDGAVILKLSGRSYRAARARSIVKTNGKDQT